MRHPVKSTPFVLLSCLCAASLLQTARAAGDHDHEHDAPPPPAERHTQVTSEQLAKELKEKAAENPAATRPPVQLPPLPAGVEELSFKDFYKMPVGPLGLEPTEKLHSMDGKRVRILGYMAEIKRENKREMIFASVPLKPQPEEYGTADEIPATHILVTVPGDPDKDLRFTPGPMLLTGVLSVGSKEGEFSYVRMSLDPAPEAAPATPSSEAK